MAEKVAPQQELGTMHLAEKAKTPVRTSSKWLLLAFYSGAVTAALITVCVFYSGGLIHGGQTTPRGGDQLHQDVKHYRYDDEGRETMDLDVSNNREIIHSHKGTANESIVVLDFEKHVGSFFDAASNSCFLAKDIRDLPDAHQLQDMLNDDGVYEGTEEETKLKVTDAIVDEDYELMAPELVGRCWGKPVYQLMEIDSVPPARQKRAPRIIVIIIIRCPCGSRMIIHH